MAPRLSPFGRIVPALGVALIAARTFALVPTPGEAGSNGPEFTRPELLVGGENLALESAGLPAASRDAWSRFFTEVGEEARVHVDPRTGHPTSILLHVPLIPGNGIGNALTFEAVSSNLRRSLAALDAAAVGRLIRRWIVQHREILGIDPAQLGAVKATQVGEELWNFSAPQMAEGLPVRGASVLGVISHGNLILIGTSAWTHVRIDTALTLSAAEAVAIGLAHAAKGQVVVRSPRLEIAPFVLSGEGSEATAGGQEEPPGVAPGARLGHRLVWVLESAPAEALSIETDPPLWETLIDARTGEILAFEEMNPSLRRRIVGGVYPLTSTDVCPAPERCGLMLGGHPMPFADTGLAPPNEFTNSAGSSPSLGGTLTTTLTGRFVRVVDSCGPILESSATGDLDLGGMTGQHDCTSSGASAGDTPAARTSFYEINKLAEVARGWLPLNSWLLGQVRVNVNINATCGASYNSSAGTLNFYRSGSGCRNSGELAGVLDHEWGHGMDDNDAAGLLSNSAEAYADIAAIYRQQLSCVGYGFLGTADLGCGTTSDGTGHNANEAQVGGTHCDLDCSGVRDADFDRHADHVPDTPIGYVCGRCASGSGPCGRQTHCAALPSIQAAWDFAARDLQAPPFNFSRTSAFLTANRLFYQGSANIGLWHSCNCAGSTADGCGASNAYMNWLTADDDNGNLMDGTPHISALFQAFSRHGIACPVPFPVNSGCPDSPTTAPTLAVTLGDDAVRLDWTAVPNASAYWVLRGEGFDGCNRSLARIATVNVTHFTDHEVVNDRIYGYAVVARGASETCFGPASLCTQATPQACSLGEVAPDIDWESGRKDTLMWSLIAEATSYSVVEGTAETLPALLTGDPDSCLRWTGASNTSGPNLVESPLPGGLRWFLVIPSDGSCEGPAGDATAGPRVLDTTGPCS